MLYKFFEDRLNIVKFITIFIFMFILFRLADLQIVKGDYYRKKSDTIRIRNIAITAPRGNIVDAYGRIIAGNKQSYSVNIMKADIPEATANDIALSVINILERNGDKYKDEVPILINPIRFSFYDEEINWKRKYNIPDSYTAKEAFKRLREDYNIPTETIDVEAYSILKEEYKVELPFTISDYVYTFKKEEIKWKESNGFKPEDSAEEVFQSLLLKYKIDRSKYGDEKAKKILAVKYLLGQKKFKSYEPVEIAANVKDQTRAQIEENKIFLPGVEIMVKPLRYYPNGDFASHIIGYMNKIGSEIEQLADKGYTPHDMIGKTGIESSMEQYLKGKDGSNQIEVNVNGSLMNTIDNIDPVPGDNVFLTIDAKLQKVAEDSLKATMEKIRSGDSSRGIASFPNATSGAAVAIDVNTGAILAMASEPKFDPNLFAAGISIEDWKSLQPDTDNRLAPRPLVNNAISNPLEPGSTMKMLTALAGLEEGKITPTEIIVDRGPYTAIPGVAPSCAIWKSSRSTHGPQNVSLAIKNSCNYFFFEVGRRLGGEIFEEYANRIGFGQYTGIELPFEFKGNVEGPEHKKELWKKYIDNYLTYNLKITDKTVKDRVKNFVHDNLSTKQMKTVLKELNITDSKAVDKILYYVRESKPRPGDVLNASIGQGMNNVTPLQLANYIATLVNGGTRYKPYLVKKVISYNGEVKLSKEPEAVDKINVSQATLEAIKKGMFAVTNEAGGTARSAFVGSKVVISGKTGTAEAGKYRPDPKNNPKLYRNYDDHAWFVSFAPYEKPQIAVAVVIFQGGHGNYAAPVAREIIEQYLAPDDIKDAVVPTNELTQ